MLLAPFSQLAPTLVDLPPPLFALTPRCARAPTQLEAQALVPQERQFFCPHPACCTLLELELSDIMPGCPQDCPACSGPVCGTCRSKWHAGMVRRGSRHRGALHLMLPRLASMRCCSTMLLNALLSACMLPGCW